MGTLLGEATLSFSVCLPSQWGSTLEGKNLLPQEQILSFKRRPYFGRASFLVPYTAIYFFQGSKLTYQNCLLLKVKSMVIYPYTLNAYSFIRHLWFNIQDCFTILRVAVEWLEQLGYGAECCQVVSSNSDDRKTLFVNPAVNGYLFQIREAVLETQENKLVAQNFYFGPLKFLF